MCLSVSLSHVWLLLIPWTVARQAPLSMKFSRQEYWSGKLFPSSGDLPDPGIEPGSPAMHADAFTIWAPSVQFSRSIVSDSLWSHEPQHTRPPCPSSTLGVYPNSCPLSRWYHLTISSSSSAFRLSQHQGLFQGLFKWVSSSHQVAKVLDFQLQHQSFQWIPRTDFL